MSASNVSDWLQRRWPGLLIGLAAAAGVCALYAMGGLRRLDEAMLDRHYQHFSGSSADERITLVEIDDGSLAAVGEWPWPRRRHAEIIRTLHELGAATIVLDLIFSEPTPPRLLSTSTHPHYDLDRIGPQDNEPGVAGNVPTAADLVYDDDELAAAIRRAGNVVLAVYARSSRHAALIADSRARNNEFRTSAWTFLAEHRHGTWPEFYRAVSPGDNIESITPRREGLLGAYRWARAARAVLENVSKDHSDLDGPAPRSPETAPNELEPPLDKLAGVASGFGLVGFERENTRGVLREIVLQGDVAGHTLPQLALAGVRRLQPDGRAALEPESLPRGPTLVHWHVPTSGRWRDSFRHFPAARLLEIADLRNAIDQNSRRYAIALAELVELQHADTPSEFHDYSRRVNEALDIRRALNREEIGDPPGGSRRELLDRLADLDLKVRKTQAEALQWLAHAAALWAEAQPDTDEERTQRNRILLLQQRFSPNGMAQEIAERNARLDRDVNALLDELRPFVSDRLCIVGYTATGTADLVATPVFDSVPGVLVHANVANTILRGTFPVRAPVAINLLLVGSCGLLMTIAGNVRGVRLGLLTMVALSAAAIITGAWLFRSQSIHISSAAVIASIVSTWAAVTIVRQSTEERVRRRLERALTQYVSPEIAGRIARRVRPRDMAPQRATVTCFFSDLGEFTRFSERLGPEATRCVLNPYLEAVSRVLITHGAIVNKFMGDGVFAFFNAPIRPCVLHAERACQAAVELLKAVAELNRALPPNGTTAGLLQVRVGISTGEVFVGDYGSEAKLDYTCIGDAVNVAARLEKANKTFGTHVLLDDVTRRGAGASFAFRSLGRLLLPGKESAAAAHELILPGQNADRAPADSHVDADFISSFERMLEFFQRGEWDACREAFAVCDRLRSGDVALERYRLAMLVASSGPTPPDWSGAIATSST